MTALIDRIETVGPGDLPDEVWLGPMICLSCEGESEDGPFCSSCLERSRDISEELDDLGVGD